MNKPLETFISYSRVNQNFAIRLAVELKTAGFCVWMDQFDIPTGARWDDEIEKALKECQIFLFIMTPASIASENAKDEMGYAIDHGKRILPVLLEKCEVPLRLRRMQYVDFTQLSFEQGIKKAQELLSQLINEIETVPSATAEPANKRRARKEPKTRPTGQEIESQQARRVPGRDWRFSPAVMLTGIVISGVGILIITALVLRPLLPMTQHTFSPPPAATVTAAPTTVPTETENARPPTIPALPTTAVLRSFTEEFDSTDRWETDWTRLLRHEDPGKAESFRYAIADGKLTVDLTHEFVWGYFVYKSSAPYANVEMEAVVSGLRSTDTFGLICQFGDQGWYEFDINGGGVFHARYVDNINSSRDEERYVIRFGYIPGFKDSYVTARENTIRARCDTNKLTLIVNDSELMTNVQSKFVLEQGHIGFAVRSYQNYPIDVIVKSIQVTEP